MDSNILPQSVEQPATGRRWVRAASVGVLGVAVAVGVWARFRGLGFSSLAADEYYFVRSIRRILVTGIPAFESGGYYVRGLLVQYLTVPAMWLSGSDELGVRIPSALFGLAASVMAYAYGRRTIGRPWALALAAMLLLSSWEVEFSRFGRMYAGLQFLTLAFLVSLHDVIGGIRGWRRYLPVVLCLLATATHETAIFLIPLLFLPALFPGSLGGRKAAIGYTLAAGVPAIAAVGQLLIEFRGIGVQDALPAGFTAAGGSAVVLPAFPFWHLGTPEASLAAVGALLGLVGLGCWLLLRRDRIGGATAAAALCLACAVSHFLLLGLLLGLLLVVRYRLPRTAKQLPAAFKLGLASLAVAVGWVAYAGWLTYGIGSRDWIEATGSLLFSEAVFRVFVWPDPSEAVLTAWRLELPTLGWLFAAALVFQLALKARDPWEDFVRNPAFFVAYLLLVLGVFTTSLVTTRYTYFAYPVALAMLVLSVRDAVRLVARPRSVTVEAALGVPVALALFSLGGDFSPRHLVEVGSYAATYRTGAYQEHENTWYARDDDVSTANFVTDAARPGDLVIAAETPAMSYYLDLEHAVYLDRRGHRFANVSRERGTLDLWSGRRLLSTPEEVDEFTRCAEGAIWLVRSLKETRWINPPEIWADQLEDVETSFQNPDRSQEVLRVRLRPDASCPGAGR
ncbi:MAG: glycosyltransferase family 39 protein [Gemmatimonadota bacterium]|nr:glycosyltransferase family 39 protein [Gemmatimonadota bacterium]